MTHLTTVLLAVRLSLAGSAPAPAPARPPPPATATATAPVTLRFAWPARLQGAIKHSYSSRSSPTRELMSPAMEVRFAVEDAPGGLHRMVFSNPKYREATDAMTLGEPTIVLFDGRGAFQGVEHTEGGFVDRMSNLPIPLPPEKKAEIRAQMEAIVVTEAREKWDELTGRWNGVTLTPGQPVKRQVKLGIGSMLARREVDAVETTTLEARVACGADDLENACVRLLVETVPARPPAQNQADRLGMVTVSVTRRVTIVLEPTTLVPHSIRTERADVVEREAPGGKGKPSTERYLQVEERIFSYAIPGTRRL